MTTCCIVQQRTFAPVKALTIILSIYLLGLSLWPCADEPLPPGGKTWRSMVSSATNPDSEQSHQHDACTPFCTCACCAVTITIAPRFTYSLIPSVEMMPIDSVPFQYVSVPLSDALTAIWQPPKLRV